MDTSPATPPEAPLSPAPQVADAPPEASASAETPPATPPETAAQVAEWQAQVAALQAELEAAQQARAQAEALAQQLQQDQLTADTAHQQAAHRRARNAMLVGELSDLPLLLPVATALRLLQPDLAAVQMLAAPHDPSAALADDFAPEPPLNWAFVDGQSGVVLAGDASQSAASQGHQANQASVPTIRQWLVQRLKAHGLLRASFAPLPADESATAQAASSGSPYRLPGADAAARHLRYLQVR